MEEETIDIEVNLGKETADKLNKMTKAELLNSFCVEILRNKVHLETIDGLENDKDYLKHELKNATNKFKICRAMLLGAIKEL